MACDSASTLCRQLHLGDILARVYPSPANDSTKNGQQPESLLVGMDTRGLVERQAVKAAGWLAVLSALLTALS